MPAAPFAPVPVIEIAAGPVEAIEPVLMDTPLLSMPVPCPVPVTEMFPLTAEIAALVVTLTPQLDELPLPPVPNAVIVPEPVEVICELVIIETPEAVELSAPPVPVTLIFAAPVEEISACDSMRTPELRLPITPPTPPVPCTVMSPVTEMIVVPLPLIKTL
jgi:hypothetical protein